jgi:ATP-dependent exoDNAse (exonuclease V) alpha subunit
LNNEKRDNRYEEQPYHHFPAEVLEALCEKRSPILITGKAGTGKSTLIKELLRDGGIRQVVLAPTGVAALHVGGQTIHSFFRIPPSLNDRSHISPIRGRQAVLIKELERIIIDEISMVRADLLDIVDLVLRNTRRKNTPFGGVHIVMVGDFYQLPPIVSWAEQEVYEKLYENKYVFSANVFKEIRLKTVELQHVFRQQEKEFVDLLGNIREGRNVAESIGYLNERCVGAHRDGRIPLLLTARNITANEYNMKELNNLPGEMFTYNGKTAGEFNMTKDKFPAPEVLYLKEGARIMMVKNDVNNRRWVNGSLGTVQSLTSDAIYVDLDQGNQTWKVVQNTWERYVYSLDPTDNTISKKIVGKYTQFPLQLAWASTIHKAQGLTLDDVRLDLSTGNFECGQTYVALSRVTSIEGLSFTQPLIEADIIVDRNLSQLLHNTNIDKPSA